jgi:uncharacterized protein YlxP (DUF503 family)
VVRKIMKQDQIYQELVELLEKFDVTVSEQNFKATHTKTKGGFCIVKNEKRFIIDKALKLNRKIDMLIDYIRTLPHEDMYVVPMIRDLLK